MRCFLISLLMILAFSPCQASNSEAEPQATEAVAEDADPVKVQLVTDIESIQPGQTFWVAVRVEIQDKWHTYWKNPGDTGMPLQVEWQLPAGFEVGELQWPYPVLLMESGLAAYGYEKEVFLFAQVTAPKNLSVGGKVDIKAKVDWLACHDSCIPGSSPAALLVPVLQETPRTNSEWAEPMAAARGKLPERDVHITAAWDGKEAFLVMLPSLVDGSQYEDAYFFSDVSNLVSYSVPQKIVQKDGKSWLTVEAEKKGPMPAEALHGLLVMTKRNGGTTALAVETPLIPDAANALDRAYNLGHEEMNLGLAMFLALIGGLILNLMPCVLPVIALKIMSFVKLSGESRLITLKHGMAFFIGALVAFWALAGVLLVLRAYGEAVGWGFQLQSPLFVAMLAFILLVFGLSLFGVFEMGTGVSSWAGTAQPRGGGLSGSFFSGVLATAVATPCTGPFLGTTVGFAVTLPAAGALMIFTSMGVGMALPYLVFAAFPQLIRFLPKPGAWMVTFKELMGFVIMATVLWLLWVFGAQTGPMGIMVLLAGFLVAAMSTWVYGKWGSPASSRPVRAVGSVIALALLSLGLWTTVVASGLTEEPSVASQSRNPKESNSTDEWIPFSPAKIAELRAKGIPVFVDFTAKWCLICQANKVVLNSDEVAKKFAQHGVVKMRADWTKNDGVITEELRKFGRSGVPLYLLYGPDNETPQVLPQVLTPDVVIARVNEFDSLQDITVGEK